MDQLWPLPTRAIDDAALEALYTYPRPDTGAWVAVSFVSSVDGGIEYNGRSAELSTPPDRRVYQLASDLADVVLLGAGTAVAEAYPGIRPDDRSAERRERHGLAPVPPLALVTSGASLPPDAPSIIDVLTPSLVLTCASADEDRRNAWSDAGAQVVLTGDEHVHLPTAIAKLSEAGLVRIDCEGGPGLVGQLLADDLVDELRLSISPMAVAGQASRLATSSSQLAAPASFTVDSLLLDQDTLLLRYLRPDAGDRSPSRASSPATAGTRGQAGEVDSS